MSENIKIKVNGVEQNFNDVENVSTPTQEGTAIWTPPSPTKTPVEKHIQITEGGKKYGFIASLLKINNQGGGSTLWVSSSDDPDDDVSGKSTLNGETVYYAKNVNWTYKSGKFTMYIVASSTNYLVAFGDGSNALLCELSLSDYSDGISTEKIGSADPSKPKHFTRHEDPHEYFYKGEFKKFYAASCGHLYYDYNMENWSGSLEISRTININKVARILFEGEHEKN